MRERERGRDSERERGREGETVREREGERDFLRTIKNFSHFCHRSSSTFQNPVEEFDQVLIFPSKLKFLNLLIFAFLRESYN